MNEAVYTFGTAIEGHLAAMKKGKTQSQESFARAKEMELRRLLEMEAAPEQFAQITAPFSRKA